MGKWRERETERCAHNDERQNWRFKRNEEQPDAVGQPAMPHRTIMESLPVLPLRATCGSMTLQQQVSVSTKGQVDISGQGCQPGTC